MKNQLSAFTLLRFATLADMFYPVCPQCGAAGDSWAPGCLIGINRRIYGPSWCDLLKWHYDAVNGRQRQVRHKVATGNWKMSLSLPAWPGQALPRLPVLPQTSPASESHLQTQFVTPKKDQEAILHQHKQNSRRTLKHLYSLTLTHTDTHTRLDECIHSWPNIGR